MVFEGEIIDAHTHLGLEAFIVKPIPEKKKAKPAFLDRMENRLEHFITHMDAHGVDLAVAFPFPLEEVDVPTANDYVLNGAQAYPDRIIPFVLIDEEPEHWLAKGAKGFKQHFLMSPERLHLDRIYRQIADAGLPLIVHFTSSNVISSHGMRSRGMSIPQQIRNIRKATPKIKLIVAHMGRRIPNQGDGVDVILQELRDMEEIYLETSTVRDPHIIARAVKLFGCDRIVFGSDFPFNSHRDADPLRIELDTILRAGLSSADMEKIFAKNIRTCLGYP